MRVFAKVGFTTIGLCMFLAQGVLAQGGTGAGSTSDESVTTTTSTSGSTHRGSSGQRVSMRIPDESAPPGGVVQMKLIVTEPTPISSGGPIVPKPAGSTVKGVQLFNPTGDVCGVAMVGASEVRVAYVTSNGMQASEYPIMTIALELSPSLPVGTQEEFTLDPSSIWTLGLLGTATPKLNHPATITVGGSISITNVVPGGGLLPAGTVVSVQGMGFQSETRVDLGGFAASSIAIVSPQEIQIVLAAATDMTGKTIQVINPDRSKDTYFSYLRGIPLEQSNRALLSSAVPIFSSLTHSQAVFASAGFASENQFSGVAVQNPNLDPATVTFTLYSSSNDALGSSTIVIPSGYRMMRETSELAQGFAPLPGSYLVISADKSIQMFGFLADAASGTVLPVTALSSQP